MEVGSYLSGLFIGWLMHLLALETSCDETAAAVAFRPGRVAQLPLTLASTGQLVVGVRVAVPREARVGSTLTLDLLQREPENGRVVGGVAFQVRVKGRR